MIKLDYSGLDDGQQLDALSAMDRYTIRAIKQLRAAEMRRRVVEYADRTGPHFITYITCMKDELKDDILEWIAYHRVLGPAGFIIMDNDSVGDMPLLLDELHRAGIICHVPWPTSSPWERQQMSAFATAIQSMQLARIGMWAGFLDVDEFLVSDRHPTIPAVLESLATRADAIHAAWVFFGSGGAMKRTDGLVIERFTRRAPVSHPKNAQGKPLFKIDQVVGHLLNPHGVVLGDMSKYCFANGEQAPEDPRQRIGPEVVQKRVDSAAVLRIHHYAVKSLEEFSLKKSRGRINYSVVSPKLYLNDVYWRSHDLNQEEDSSLAHFANAVRAEMDRLNLMGS